MAATSVRGSEKAQVVVRLACGMRLFEARQQRQNLTCTRTQKVAQKRLDAVLFVVGDLDAARRDPNRGRLVVAQYPHPRVAQRASDVEPPPRLEAVRVG